MRYIYETSVKLKAEEKRSIKRYGDKLEGSVVGVTECTQLSKQNQQRL